MFEVDVRRFRLLMEGSHSVLIVFLENKNVKWPYAAYHLLSANEHLKVTTLLNLPGKNKQM
jgi:hypothetical protein